MYDTLCLTIYKECTTTHGRYRLFNPDAAGFIPMAKNTFNLKNNPFLVGVISDTHGHLSARAAELLDGVDLIVHAGDIDTPEVLQVSAL